MKWTWDAVDALWTNATFQEAWLAVGRGVCHLCTIQLSLLAVEGSRKYSTCHCEETVSFLQPGTQEEGKAVNSM